MQNSISYPVARVNLLLEHALGIDPPWEKVCYGAPVVSWINLRHIKFGNVPNKKIDLNWGFKSGLTVNPLGKIWKRD